LTDIKSTLIAEAGKLTDHRFTIIPLKDKIAIIKYKHRRKDLATAREIDLWFSNGNGLTAGANGIAIAINDTEFGIDTDGEKCETIFLNIISRLSTELQFKIHKTMHTKSPRGHHRTFKYMHEDFPNGIKARTYFRFNGEHNEITLIGKDHILTERGPGYEIINGVEDAVTLTKTEVNELLGALASFRAEQEAITAVVKVLRTYYIKPNRNNIIFAISGYLHKGRTPQRVITEIAKQLIDVTEYSDENPNKVFQTIRDTCGKDPHSDEVSGYKRLHEALTLASPPGSKKDSVSNTIEQVGHILKAIGLFAISGKTHLCAQQEENSGDGDDDSRERNNDADITNAKIIPAVDLDPYIRDRDYAEYYINTVKKTVRKEDSLVRQVFYTALSKDSDSPLNLGVLATTSWGKTYGIIQTLQYFPDKDIWYIGSMSPKVIIRQHGVLVDSNNQPLKPKLEELKKLIKKSENAGNEQEAERLDRELEELKATAKVLIDLQGLCLVFLEPPHKETWNILKATLSHDRFEIEHPYVYEVQNLGFTVKKIVTRGWPSCIFASARNESKWEMWPEIQSRFLVVSPNIVPEKVLEGNILIGQSMSLPDRIKHKIIVSRREKDLAIKCAKYLMQQVKIKMTQEPDKQKQLFWIPFGVILSAALPSEKGIDNRVTMRIFLFLRMVTILRAHLRFRLKYWDEDLIIPAIADLHETLHIMQNLSGIPNYKLLMYDNYYLPCYREKYERQNGEPDISSDGKKNETVFGLSNRGFCDYYKKKTGKILPTRNFRETFIEEWYNNGLIEEVDSVINAKQKIYYPIVLPSESDKEIQHDNNDEDISVNAWLESGIRRLGDSAPSPIFLQPKPVIVQKNSKKIPENWLEMQLSAILQWEIHEESESDLLAVFRFYDENGSRICLCQFIDRYHNASPSLPLNSYFSNGISCKKLEKNTKPLKYLNKHEPEKCGIMGELLKSPNTPMPSFSSINLTNQYYSYLITRTRTLPNTEKLGGCIANSSNESERFSETKISDDGTTLGNAH
jgi:hypothetical protein